MLDGRVKTLHPRVHGGLLADRRLDDHRVALLGAGIAPFELVVVNLYPFAAALERPGHHGRRADRGDRHRRSVDGSGGGQEPRQRGDRHVARPVRGGARGPRQRGRAHDVFRRELALEAFAHTAAYDARIAAELPGRLVEAGLLEPPDDPYPPTLTVALEKVETLRYGENPHQPAARYRRPGTTLDDGLFGVERAPLQGKALSYNNVLDAAAAAGLGRALRGAGRRHRQAHEPVRGGGTPDPARSLVPRRSRRTRSAPSAGSWRSRARSIERWPRRSPRSSSRSSSRPPSAGRRSRSWPRSRTCASSSTSASRPTTRSRRRRPHRPGRSGRPVARSS